MDFYLRQQGLPQPRLGLFVVLFLFPFLISFFSSWPEIFPCKYQVFDCHDLYILSKSCLLRFVFTIQLAIVFYSVVRIVQTALKQILQIGFLIFLVQWLITQSRKLSLTHGWVSPCNPEQQSLLRPHFLMFLSFLLFFVSSFLQTSSCGK